MEIMRCPDCRSEEIQTAPIGYFCEDCGHEFLKGSKGIASETIDPLESKIWDYITDSAKKRFDYNSFKKGFDDFFGETEVDNILWMIIEKAAADADVLEISSHIFMQLAMLGFTLPKDEIKSLVIELCEKFSLEITVTKNATYLLNIGSDAKTVFNRVKDTLR